MKYKVKFELEHYPTKCVECPAFIQTPYTCHNEIGLEADCRFGYMTRCDMRDFHGNRLFEKCDIVNNPDVTIVGE